MKRSDDCLNKNNKCKKCNGKVGCVHSAGINGIDYVEIFELICENCGKLDSFTHTDMTGNDQETCPWCDKQV